MLKLLKIKFNIIIYFIMICNIKYFIELCIRNVVSLHIIYVKCL